MNPRARLIPVYNMSADEVAQIVKEVYAEKMQGASNRTIAVEINGRHRPTSLRPCAVAEEGLRTAADIDFQ